MKIVNVKIRSWEEPKEFDSHGLDLQEGDNVVVETEQGLEIGRVVSLCEAEKKGENPRPVLRKAIDNDSKKLKYYEDKKREVSEFAREKIEKQGLAMKLVDVHFAFDGSRITFAFTALGRIDFRELLRDLTRHFQKSIRLQQIGSRDEAKCLGGYGMCGREICCARFLGELRSVTTDMARLQETTHKGSEKNSGLCGRLKCCLAYESAIYEELEREMPEIDSEIKTPQGKGVVVGRNILNQSVRVKLQKSGLEVEVPLKKD